MRYDKIWLDARLVTVNPAAEGLGIIERGAIAAKDGRIAYVGLQADLPSTCGNSSPCSDSSYPEMARRVLVDTR